jgi:hypothetical protein
MSVELHTSVVGRPGQYLSIDGGSLIDGGGDGVVRGGGRGRNGGAKKVSAFFASQSKRLRSDGQIDGPVRDQLPGSAHTHACIDVGLSIYSPFVSVCSIQFISHVCPLLCSPGTYAASSAFDKVAQTRVPEQFQFFGSKTSRDTGPGATGSTMGRGRAATYATPGVSHL